MYVENVCKLFKVRYFTFKLIPMWTDLILLIISDSSDSSKSEPAILIPNFVSLSDSESTLPYNSFIFSSCNILLIVYPEDSLSIIFFCISFWTSLINLI